jgi:hypothetical protein
MYPSFYEGFYWPIIKKFRQGSENLEGSVFNQWGPFLFIFGFWGEGERQRDFKKFLFPMCSHQVPKGFPKLSNCSLWCSQ